MYVCIASRHNTGKPHAGAGGGITKHLATHFFGQNGPIVKIYEMCRHLFIKDICPKCPSVCGGLSTRVNDIGKVPEKVWLASGLRINFPSRGDGFNAVSLGRSIEVP